MVINFHERELAKIHVHFLSSVPFIWLTLFLLFGSNSD